MESKGMKILYNIDWLEVYGIEPKSAVELDAEYYRNAGYEVKVREYGTKIYEQMFTIKIGGVWCIEVRRKPHESKNGFSVMKKGSCHLRLTNQACYLKKNIELLRTFMERHQIEYRGISRVDVCADFVRFSHDKKPLTLINKILKREVVRVNKGVFSIHGRESWNGQNVQTLSWGSSTSMVQTKMYNKTQEMEQMKPKPYISRQWNDEKLNEGHEEDDVWRIEFSIKSRCKKWIKCENELGDKNKLEFIKQDISIYESKENLAMLFHSLANFYFRFKVMEYDNEGNTQRKTRCDDYELFDEQIEILKPIGDVECSIPTRTEKVLLNYLDKLRDDVRGFWNPEWERSILCFKDIIGRQKMTKNICHENHLYEQLWKERCSEVYRELYESVEHRTLDMLEPEIDVGED